MTKNESEIAIRPLVHDWAKTQEQPTGWHPSFGAFVSWLKQNGYGHYLDFNSRMGASTDAEQWFDQELGQTWRN